MSVCFVLSNASTTTGPRKLDGSTPASQVEDVTAVTIERLAGFLPNARTSVHDQSGIDSQAVQSFVARYANVAVGWSFATEFARLGRFPVTMYGKDAWVHRAFMMRAQPKRFHNKHIADAHCLATHPSGRTQGESIKALLLSACVSGGADAHIARVAKSARVPKKTVEAFEVLFYNVMDRWEDHLFIANTVYPETRGVELQEDYFRSTSIFDLLKRAGHNYQDPEMIEYMIGIGDKTYMSKLSGRKDREDQLERFLMGNGMLIASGGGVNSRSPGLGRTTALMTASRQAGPKVEDPAIVGIGAYIADQFMNARRSQQAHALRIAREDAGQGATVEV